MLDTLAVDTLTRDCRTIYRLSHLLDQAKTPGAGAHQDNAGKAPRSPGPRDPANIHAIDLDIDTADILTGWLTNLADDLAIPHAWATNCDRHPGTLALRLASVAHLIATREWATDCVDEVHATARHLADHLTPPDPTPDPTPTRQLTPDAAHRVVTATEAAIILDHLGHQVTPDQIRQWANRGHITPVGRNASRRRTYRLGDITTHLTEQETHA